MEHRRNNMNNNNSLKANSPIQDCFFHNPIYCNAFMLSAY